VGSSGVLPSLPPWAKKVVPEREILPIVKKAESLRVFFARCVSRAVHKKFTVNIH
jgi:hypothetical protein